jgi:hypothetical protein
MRRTVETIQRAHDGRPFKVVVSYSGRWSAKVCGGPHRAFAASADGAIGRAIRIHGAHNPVIGRAASRAKWVPEKSASTADGQELAAVMVE